MGNTESTLISCKTISESPLQRCAALSREDGDEWVGEVRYITGQAEWFMMRTLRQQRSSCVEPSISPKG